jgi:hypothetical protein
MNNREKEKEQPEFSIADRDYGARAWYLKDTSESKGDALIEITFGGEIIRKFIFPAYKIWNIQAHFADIVDGEIEKNDSGYRMAASTGIG